MSAASIPSHLSDSKYLYDLVVAITQASISEIMEAFLAQLKEPTVTICYIADDQDNPVLIDYETLVKNANGTDPFIVQAPANVDCETNQDIMNLRSARFKFGFRITLGKAKVPDPSNFRDIVELSGFSLLVMFNLYCSTFQVVRFVPDMVYLTTGTWLNVSQSPGNPWLFTFQVSLHLEEVDKTAYNTLPEDVQKKIQSLGSDAFSVQQLVFDLTEPSTLR